MEKKFLTSKELFRDIKAREIYKIEYYKDLNQEQKDDVLYFIEGNYKHMKSKLDSAIDSLGLEVDRYKDSKNQWKIPIEEKELFIRAYNESTSPAGKKLRGVKKDELNISEIHKEIKSMEELIDKTYSSDDAQEVKGYLEYTTNFKILEKISQVKEPINKMIIENMENILNGRKDKKIIEDTENLFDWGEDNLRFLNIDEAVYLLDYYKELIENTTKMWNSIVDIFCEIRNSENEVTDENDKVKCAESETVLTEAIKIYNKRLRSPKLEDKQIDRNSIRKTNKEHTDEEMKAVKEVLESYLKAGK
ncbi:hypothetical protein [Clostridium sp. YIM B02506]|uniref:hypothetical protein n=1 Tax=Clostridium sp. YIM B02506 TaxID=2910680 RepID=UPI001EEDCDA5|nr:hypothetical protein [Clostridium sp. YIM B02506]